MVEANAALQSMLGAGYVDFFVESLPGIAAARLDTPFETFTYEHRIERRGRPTTWFDVEVSPMTVGPTDGEHCAIAIVTDVTERRTAVESLTYDASHDSLTQLPNRPAFLDALRRMLETQKRTNAKLTPFSRNGSNAVLFLDLDEFKPVNDTLGHAAGDLLLVATANRLRELAGTRHLPARFHGDEFGFLLHDVTTEEALEFAERVKMDMRRPFTISERSVNVSTSIGLVMVTEEHVQGESVLRDADAAMYRAKRNGRSRVEMFDESMRVEMRRMARLRTDIKPSLKNGEFYMLYQPVVDLMTGRTHGCEALMRWKHPDEGDVSPDEFIGLAEKSDAIVDLGRFALREACKFLADLDRSAEDAGRFTVAVNLSVRQIREPDLVDDIVRTLEEFDVPGDRLLLEITETAMLEHDHGVADALSRLKEVGVRLCIDDFGMGYSSLRYLYQFPIDLIKLDKAFVSGGSLDMLTSEPIVALILSLAKVLNIGVIAEGIETRSQAEVLRVLGCSVGQGYFFSRPIEPERFLDYVHESDVAAAEHQRLKERKALFR